MLFRLIITLKLDQLQCQMAGIQVIVQEGKLSTIFFGLVIQLPRTLKNQHIIPLFSIETLKKKYLGKVWILMVMYKLLKTITWLLAIWLLTSGYHPPLAIPNRASQNSRSHFPTQEPAISPQEALNRSILPTGELLSHQKAYHRPPI